MNSDIIRYVIIALIVMAFTAKGFMSIEDDDSFEEEDDGTDEQ